MAFNNLLNLAHSKVALKPPLPPLPTRPFLSAPSRLSPLRLSLRSEPPPPQRVRSSASTPSDGAAPSPPSSREEAVAQARSCLSTALQKPLNNSVPLKKLKRQRQARFRAEIPVVDDSPGSLARLTFDVFTGAAGVKRKGAPARLILVWPSAEALAVALREFKNWGDSTTAHAQLGSVAQDSLSACDAAVFLAPGPSQVEKVKAAAAALDPRPVVLFNPAWSFDEEEGEGFDAGARGFVGSFNVVYSFTGLEVRGLLSKKRGVLLRCVEGGRFGGESWVLMVEDDAPAKQGEFKVVSRLKRRPTIGEVETMLYNLMAANSPVTKSARFLREMVSNVTGGKAKQ
ncbi:uncharacterized protein LOC133885844 [Phragmites australis]|uniref:uncharacterized protein LOC133885844 n=1 Tax=Phragmites australis TaxID=29695 RepID=UPI002D76F640|nr:uncharacterized protein LOC133885844 [Phragmites australis]